MNQLPELCKLKFQTGECNRYYCQFCLKGNYEITFDKASEKYWICPFCRGDCFCSRCSRYDRLYKLLALYISFGGDINLLYKTLISKNHILLTLSNKIMLNNVIIVPNESVLRLIKVKDFNRKKNSEQNQKKFRDLLKQCMEYKDQIIVLKDYFDNLFKMARIDKHLNQYINENKIGEITEDHLNFLGKKRLNEN